MIIGCAWICAGYWLPAMFFVCDVLHVTATVVSCAVIGQFVNVDLSKPGTKAHTGVIEKPSTNKHLCAGAARRCRKGPQFKGQ